jgi:hypothetical protein
MNQPIGYWLKHLDGLIDAAFDRVFFETGLTRRHWQAMNAPASTTPPIMAELQARGWVAEGALTPEGEKARAALLRRVEGIRGTLMSGLSQEDYERTVSVLEHMANNLQRVSP